MLGISRGVSSFFICMIPRQPMSSLFPYTTLFRSPGCDGETAIAATAADALRSYAVRVSAMCLDSRAGAHHRDVLRVAAAVALRSEEHTSELQSLAYLVCRLLLEKKNKKFIIDLSH